MTWQTWIHSIVAAFIGGASSAVSAVIVDPGAFNVNSVGGLQHIGEIAVVGGIIPVLALLKQSPLPSLSQTTTAIVTQTTEVTKQ